MSNPWDQQKPFAAGQIYNHNGIDYVLFDGAARGSATFLFWNPLDNSIVYFGEPPCESSDSMIFTGSDAERAVDIGDDFPTFTGRIYNEPIPNFDIHLD